MTPLIKRSGVLMLCVVSATFAFHNDSRATINLWPLGYEASVPVWAYTLAVLFVGVAAGIIAGRIGGAGKEKEMP